MDNDEYEILNNYCLEAANMNIGNIFIKESDYKYKPLDILDEDISFICTGKIWLKGINREEKTLGEKLLEIREDIINSGQHLLNWNELEKELINRRGINYFES